LWIFAPTAGLLQRIPATRQLSTSHYPIYFPAGAGAWLKSRCR
jgi:hypothetical protein